MTVALLGDQGLGGRVVLRVLDLSRPAVRVPFWYNEGIQGLGWLNLVSSLQSTNDSVLAVGFQPRDSSSIVTRWEIRVHFWNWNGGTGVPGTGDAHQGEQSVFGVSVDGCRDAGRQSADESIGLGTIDPNASNSQWSSDL